MTERTVPLPSAAPTYGLASVGSRPPCGLQSPDFHHSPLTPTRQQPCMLVATRHPSKTSAKTHIKKRLVNSRPEIEPRMLSFTAGV
jgi:hypothetical protein